MRIAFNAQFLLLPQNGTGRYVYNLLGALGRVDGINEYRILTPRDPVVRPETPNSFKWQTFPVGALSRGGENIERLVWEQRTFSMAAKRVEADIAHVPQFAPPLRTYGIPTIVSILDVIPMRLPEYRATPSAQAYTQLLWRAASHATAVIAISEFTKHDIMEVLHIPEDRIRVIRLAVDSRFRPAAPSDVTAVREKYGLGPRYILNVGGLDARKNIATLIGAFATVYLTLRDPNLRLFIAGDPNRLGSTPVFPDWRPLAEALGVAEQITCMPVDEPDMPALYSGASCFVFTSRYEGFGFTPLEAMACGAPVVCSNSSALPEIVGVAGSLVDPMDAESIAGAVLRVLESPELAEGLRDRGLAHVRNFSWDRTAAETCAFYADVAGRKST
jgi:glycosyltransferase involved in cell wall biosynthesis